MTTLAGDGRGGVAARTVWGSGWGAKGALVSAPGWNGNGRPVLITFDRADGILSAYEVSSALRFRAGPAANLTSGAASDVVVGDVTGSAHPDVVSMTSAGGLIVHAGLGDGGFATGRQIGQGWRGIRVSAAGDFDHDGVPDLLAQTSTGALLVYPFRDDRSGVLDTPFSIGQGFGSFRVLGVGGWSSSTSADVLAIDGSTGEMRWYVGQGRAGLRGGSVIGTGWRSMEVVGLGDVVGSGNNDLLARDTVTGVYWVYPATARGGFATRRAVTGVPALTGGMP